MWKQQYRDAFGKYAANPEHRDLLTSWQGQWKETQGYITQKEQEYADYRKRFDPLHEVLSPYENHWRMQGMDTVSGVRQLVSYAEALAKDPASMIPQLAQMYGVDLQSLVAEQPYIDPQVSALQQQVQQMQQAEQWQRQAAQQQQLARLSDEVRAFETAADEQGNPKAPHFQRVFNTMVALANGGAAKSIQEAYDKAVLLDSELQAEIAEARAKQEATARAAEVNKAQAASRTVKSKGAEGVPPVRSAREEFAANFPG